MSSLGSGDYTLTKKGQIKSNSRCGNCLVVLINHPDSNSVPVFTVGIIRFQDLVE